MWSCLKLNNAIRNNKTVFFRLSNWSDYQKWWIFFLLEERKVIKIYFKWKKKRIPESIWFVREKSSYILNLRIVCDRIILSLNRCSLFWSGSSVLKYCSSDRFIENDPPQSIQRTPKNVPNPRERSRITHLFLSFFLLLLTFILVRIHSAFTFIFICSLFSLLFYGFGMSITLEKNMCK